MYLHILLFICTASVRHDDCDMVVQILNDIKMSNLQLVWKTIHQLEALLEIGKTVFGLFGFVEVQAELVHQ